MISKSLAAAAGLLLITGATAGPQQPAARLEDRLRDYIARFEREASALVAEEHYVQQVIDAASQKLISSRELRSDYVLVKPVDSEPWLGWRDIYEVDRSPVRERDARLVQLLTSTAPDSVARASAFAAEGSRFNLGPERTVNTPTLPMQLLAKANAPRFRLRAPRGWQHQAQVILTFEERVRPTLVRTPEGFSVETRGTIAVRVADGAILGAHLRFFFPRSGDKRPGAVLNIEYADVTGITVPVPVRMIEELPMPAARATGVATYSNYRRFQTSVRIR